ncbi:MAG: hypothetical protein ACK559_36815, partial [bacterium]
DEDVAGLLDAEQLLLGERDVGRDHVRRHLGLLQTVGAGHRDGLTARVDRGGGDAGRREVGLLEGGRAAVEGDVALRQHVADEQLAGGDLDLGRAESVDDLPKLGVGESHGDLQDE